MKRDGTILDVSGLRIERGKTVILRDVSWRVTPGQHWAILGANGSGKTSLLSALTGYLTPTAGEVRVLGRCYGQDDWQALRREIGLVSSSIRQWMAPDEPALLSVISGKYAMIDFWGRLTHRDRREGAALLRRMECSHLAARPWTFLSQGERQRVLIGRALMARPRLLILDEPCAGLDPVAREHFLQWLDRMGRRRSAPALVLVTHHVEEIMPVFTHALVLTQGQVVSSGSRRHALTSDTLSKAFGCRVRLRNHAGRFALSVGSAASQRRVV